jgi:MYXO-CTERM domain-containing protein
MLTRACAIAPVVLLVAAPCFAATITVGPSGQYPAPCAAFAAAQDGDRVEIDASGSYAGDVCAIAKSSLTIRGVNGRAHIDAAGKDSGGKAIWVVQGNDTIIENIELSGAAVSDKNGAGIRQEGVNLTLRSCYFHDNENGILAGDNASSNILIENSEFANNGIGDGQTHNMYINHVGSFTIRYSYSHHSNIGHLVKSRALKNVIVYNRLTDEDSIKVSYEIDLPNGGLSLVMGNLIHQAKDAENGSIVSYAREAASNPDQHLYVINNTFINERSAGTFLNIQDGVPPVLVRNNIFVGAGTVISQAGADTAGNFDTGDPMLVNTAGYDYRLQPGSPCVDKGVDVAAVGEFNLTPDHQYLHPAGTESRASVGQIDIGAYELNGGGGPDSGVGGAGGTGAGGSPGAGGSNVGGSAQGGGAGYSPDASAGSAGAFADAASDAAQPGSGPSASPAGDDGGCGCRTASNDLPRCSLLVLLAIGAVAARRRRPRAPLA